MLMGTDACPLERVVLLEGMVPSPLCELLPITSVFKSHPCVSAIFLELCESKRCTFPQLVLSQLVLITQDLVLALIGPHLCFPWISEIPGIFFLLEK